MLCASCERWCQVTAPRQNVHRPITGPRGTLAPRSSTHVRPPDPAEVCRVPASRGPFPGCRPRRARGADAEWRQTHARGGFPSTLGGGSPHRTGSVAGEVEPLERSDNGVGGCRCARAEWRWCGGRSGRDAQRDQRTRQRSRRTWRARWAGRAGPRSVPWTGPASGTGSASRTGSTSRPKPDPRPATSCTQPLTLADRGTLPRRVSHEAQTEQHALGPQHVSREQPTAPAELTTRPEHSTARARSSSDPAALRLDCRRVAAQRMPSWHLPPRTRSPDVPSSRLVT